MLIACIVLAKVQYISPYRTTEFLIENGIDKEHESKKWHYKKAVNDECFFMSKTKCLFIRAFIFVFVLMNAALLFAFEA